VFGVFRGLHLHFQVYQFALLQQTGSLKFEFSCTGLAALLTQ